ITCIIFLQRSELSWAYISEKQLISVITGGILLSFDLQFWQFWQLRQFWRVPHPCRMGLRDFCACLFARGISPIGTTAMRKWDRAKIEGGTETSAVG
ncbi:MAG TPA: hypothetical protein VKD65_10055, partial [Candidatus Angelobacter sp.]|nr:hypothetical protein [Candidatus Angelobacter sp.]